MLLCSGVYAQEVSKSQELDSIYAQQALLYKAKDYAEIIALSEQAKAIELKNAQDSITFARITAYIGYANNKFANYFKSIEGFEAALNYIPSEKSSAVINTNYNILYDLLTRYYSLRRYKKALSIANRAERLLNDYDYIRASRHTWLYQRKFRIYSALGFYDKAALEVEKIKQKLEPITNETDEAMRYGWMRYYRSSLLLSYNEALNLKEKTSAYENEIIPLRKNIELNLSKLDSVFETTASLQKPTMRSQFSNLSFYIGALYYVADFYKEFEAYDRSINLINKAIRLSEIAKEPDRNVTEYLRFKANVLNEIGHTQDALVLIDSIKNTYKSNSFHLNDLYEFKGDTYAKANQLDSALHYYSETLKLIHGTDEALQDDFQNFSSRHQFPNDCEQIDRMSYMLFKYFNQDSVAMHKARILNDIAYNEFVENHKDLNLSIGNKLLYNRIIQCRLELNKNNFKDKNTFISNLENISNRLAWQEFSQSRVVVKLPIIDSLEHIEFQIRKQIVQAKQARNQKQEDSLKGVLQTYKDHVSTAYPTISDFTQNTFDVTSFQKLLGDDDIVLKYLFFYDQFVIFQITKDGIEWELKPWTKATKGLLNSHLEYLKNPNSKFELNPELTKLLLPEKALTYNSLTIVPDTPIYSLPFETLSYKSNYLVKEKAIHYSSHLRFAFFESDVDNNTKTKATIFAPEYPKGNTSLVTRNSSVFLEGAQKEAKVLEALFTSEAFIGKTATKSNFINHKSKGNILHLAMHASLDDDEPVFSYFNFSNDEKLFLEELYGLNIPVDLAVLSACNTAVGKEDGSLSMVSLQRAFNFSGTKAAVASLWEVPDATTSQIMISFYNYLKDGKTKSVALQMAKNEYLNTAETPKMKHPYYWAGFILYGSDTPITHVNYNWVWIAVGVVCMVLLLYVLFNKFWQRDTTETA